MQFGIQLLYQRYCAITKLLIVESKKPVFRTDFFIND